MTKLFKHHTLIGIIVLGSACLTFGFIPFVNASKTQRELAAEEEHSTSKPASSQSKPASSQSLRVKEQQEKGILEKDRDYSEKSDWVKNRDRVEGAAQKIGDTIKDLF